MNKKSIQKIKNPKGPYKVKLTYKGTDFTVTIDNETFQDFNVKMISDSVVDWSLLDSLKDYLKQEGFLDEALHHNLYW
jgi:hypothetical protein